MGKHYQHAHNFQEARDFAYLCYVPYELNSDVKEVFADDKCNNLTAESHRFWVMARAVKEFYKAEGGDKYLPLVGKLPDITTTAQSYVALQKLFNAKAAADAQAVIKHTHALLKSIGHPANSISDDMIIFFAKNAPDMKVIRYSPVTNEFDSTKIAASCIEYWDEKGKWFLANAAAGRFQVDQGRLPGDRNSEQLHDFEALKKYSDALLKELDFDSDALPDEYLLETCRSGGSQIHTTCAYVGGCASQEIIKFLTKQWLPINNTFIYDGITGNSGAFTL